MKVGFVVQKVLIEEAEEEKKLDGSYSGNGEVEDLENDPIAEVFGSDRKNNYCRAVSFTSSMKQVKMNQNGTYKLCELSDGGFVIWPEFRIWYLLTLTMNYVLSFVIAIGISMELVNYVLIT